MKTHRKEEGESKKEKDRYKDQNFHTKYKYKDQKISPPVKKISKLNFITTKTKIHINNDKNKIKGENKKEEKM